MSSDSPGNVARIGSIEIGAMHLEFPPCHSPPSATNMSGELQASYSTLYSRLRRLQLLGNRPRGMFSSCLPASANSGPMRSHRRAAEVPGPHGTHSLDYSDPENTLRPLMRCAGGWVFQVSRPPRMQHPPSLDTTPRDSLSHLP